MKNMNTVYVILSIIYNIIKAKTMLSRQYVDFIWSLFHMVDFSTHEQTFTFILFLNLFLNKTETNAFIYYCEN